MSDIITVPDARLKKISSAAVPADPRAILVARRLSELIDSIPHALGIAAPQTGENIRIIAVDASRARRPCRNRGRMILFNPQIISSSGRITTREGCMSVPGFRGYVERAADIKVQALSADAGSSDALRSFRGGIKLRPAVFRSAGFEAVILQHEIDHLDGILFIDRVKRF